MQSKLNIRKNKIKRFVKFNVCHDIQRYWSILIDQIDNYRENEIKKLKLKRYMKNSSKWYLAYTIPFIIFFFQNIDSNESNIWKQKRSFRTQILANIGSVRNLHIIEGSILLNKISNKAKNNLNDAVNFSFFLFFQIKFDINAVFGKLNQVWIF